MDIAIRKTAAHATLSTLCEQIDEACRHLSGGHPSGTHIHDARKAIKRSRATLRLVRDALPDRTYRLANETLRDAARPLSGVRDGRALIDSLDDVVVRERLEPRESMSLRRALRQELRDLRRKMERDDRTFQRTLASLRAARNRVARSGLDPCGWPLAPERIGKIAERAHRLSNRLGDDHDLSVLRQKAIAHKRAFRARGELDALTDGIRHRQSRLRKKAFKIGAKVYDAKPARFRCRFDRYCKRAPEP